MTKIEHGTCPVCKESVVLSLDGRVAAHNLRGTWKKGSAPDEETAELADALGVSTILVPTKCSGGGRGPVVS